MTLGFKGFLIVEGRGKLTASGAAGEEHVKKYITPHLGSEEYTHTLAAEHDDLPAGSHVKLKKVVSIKGKYHVEAEDKTGNQHTIPISKLYKPGEAPKNKGHDYETKFVDRMKHHGLMPEHLSGAGSTAGTVTVSKTRDNWGTAGTSYITVTWSKVTGATGYNVYYLDDTNGGTEHRYIGSVAQPSGATVSFTDYGEEESPMNTFVIVPGGNTTTGPKFAQMELSGNRIWATLDPDNPYRVYWSGAGSDIGAFSEFNGGGYIDLEKGGRERPTAVVHYRDGRGGARLPAAGGGLQEGRARDRPGVGADRDSYGGTTAGGRRSAGGGPDAGVDEGQRQIGAATGAERYLIVPMVCMKSS